MAFRSYQKIYAQRMSSSSFSWGGTNYSNILHLDGDAVPDSVSVSNTTQIYGQGSYSSHVVVINQNYVLPYPFDITAAIDGTVSGAFKVETNDPAAVSSVDVKLLAIDSDGNSRELCDENAWSGSMSGDNSLAAMYWFSLHEEVYSGERLVLNIQVTGYSEGYAGNVYAWIKLHHTKNTDELSITLPMVI